MKQKPIIFVSLAILLLINTPLSAGVIFQSGDPALSGIAWVSDFDPPPGSTDSQQVAGDFSLSPGSTTIRDIHWWGGYAAQVDGQLLLQDTSTIQPTDNFTIRIFADDAGGPAVNPDTDIVVGAVTRTIFNQFLFEYSVDIAAITLNADTTSWLSIVNNTAVDSLLGWGWLANAVSGPLPFRISDGQPWIIAQAVSSQLVFQLTDDIPSVPEPSTLMLLGIGLAGLGWMGRKKKTNH